MGKLKPPSRRFRFSAGKLNAALWGFCFMAGDKFVFWLKTYGFYESHMNLLEQSCICLWIYIYLYIYIYIYIYTLEESPPLEPLGPHVEDLGQQFEFILAPFWQPLGTLGTTLGAIGHHLGNLVDPRVKIRSSLYPHGQLWFQFGVH